MSLICAPYRTSIRKVFLLWTFARTAVLPPSEYSERNIHSKSLNRAFLRKAYHSDCKAVWSGKDNEGCKPSVNCVAGTESAIQSIDFCLWFGSNLHVLLVLTERLTRREYVRIMPSKHMTNVVRVLDNIEKKLGSDMFTKIFKTITVDNGSEFSDHEGMERSIGGGKRTKVYFCHPYSSYERGSNENLNKMVRRWYPKGCSFDKVTDENIAELEKWMNEYPRGIFGYDNSAEMYRREFMRLCG